MAPFRAPRRAPCRVGDRTEPRRVEVRRAGVVPVPAPHVLVAEFLDAEGLAALAPARVTYRPDLAAHRLELLALVATADALVVRNAVRVDREVVAAGRPRLRVVGRLGTGLDNVDLEACAEAGVAVVAAPGANAQAVAEYVFAGLLEWSRRIARADQAVRAGRWPRAEFLGRELAGRTLGILGLGAVGRRVARAARGLGMSVVGYDPVVRPGTPAFADLEVAWAEPEEVLRAADVLTLHLPLTPETRHRIGARELALLRPGAVLVNAARGGLVDEAALLQALVSGHLAGAILDVREEEPPPQPDPLAARPEVLCTPHIAGWTVEAHARIARTVAEGVLAALGAGREGGSP
jgi:(S)-sulfolactate dehydrogenase